MYTTTLCAALVAASLALEFLAQRREQQDRQETYARRIER